MKKTKEQNQKGITLISLVITIILLLILAAVAINLAVDSDGLFRKAGDAANTWNTSAQAEQTELENLMLMANSVGGTNPPAPPAKSNLTEDEIAELTENGIAEITGNNITNANLKDNENIRAVITGEVPIPNGFYYVGGTEADGVIISDSASDSGKGTDHETAHTLVGNQFVWIPVENPSEFIPYEGYKGGSLQDSLDSSYEPAPTESQYENEVTEYNTMKTSVTNNKGFYVARYEASNENGKAASKAGKSVWKNIAWGTSMTEIGTEGAVYQSQQMYTETTYGVTSTLIYGVQWDAIMAYIDPAYKTGTCEATSFVVNSTGKGFYNFIMGAPTTTASNSAYSVKNIYDLAGNFSEWTMEAFKFEEEDSWTRVCRGGNYISSGERK